MIGSDSIAIESVGMPIDVLNYVYCTYLAVSIDYLPDNRNEAVLCGTALYGLCASMYRPCLPVAARAHVFRSCPSPRARSLSHTHTHTLEGAPYLSLK